MNCCFDIFEVFSFNRTDKAFEICLSDGDSGYYNTMRRGLQAGGHQGPGIILPKALRILLRLCSQVPAKVQSALLVACVRSLRGRRGLSPKTNNASKDQNKTEQAITMPNENKKKTETKANKTKNQTQPTHKEPPAAWWNVDPASTVEEIMTCASSNGLVWRETKATEQEQKTKIAIRETCEKKQHSTVRKPGLPPARSSLQLETYQLSHW